MDKQLDNIELHEEKIFNHNLESILKEWQFPKNIIEKYKALKILEIFDWQAKCLQIDKVLGNLNLHYNYNF